MSSFPPVVQSSVWCGSVTVVGRCAMTREIRQGVAEITDALSIVLVGDQSFWARVGLFSDLTPLDPPNSFPMLNPSNFVPKNGFPVVKGLTPLDLQPLCLGQTTCF